MTLDSNPIRSRRRFLAIPLVGVVSVALAVGGFAGVAHADDTPITWTPVSDEASLQAALTAETPDIVLTNDITVTAPSLTNLFAAVINLHGYTLTTNNFSMGTSGRLDLDNQDDAGNPLSTGSLDATSSTAGLAGISDNGNAQVYIQDATVVAIGGAGAAGIGGDSGSNSGYLQSDDSSITATGGSNAAGIGGGDGGSVSQMIAINTTSLTVTAGSNSAAIGGGNGGGVLSGNTDMSIDSTGLPVRLSAADAAVMGPGKGGSTSGAGQWIVSGDTTIDAPSYLNVPNDGGDYRVGGTLSGTGSITGSGTLDNHGAITYPDSRIGSDLTIIENNWNVDFDAGAQGTPEHQFARVYAPSFAAGDRSIPTGIPTANGQVFTGWQSGDNPAQPFSPSDNVLTEGLHYYAAYTTVTSLAIVPLVSTPRAGDTVTFKVNGLDSDGNVGDQSPYVTLSSNVLSDKITGTTITFGTKGLRTITATLVMSTTNHLTTTLPSFTVDVGPLSKYTLTPSKTTGVLSGDTVSFTTEGSDAGGDDLGDLSHTATLSSNIPSDVVDNTTHSVTFTTVGTHTITASGNGGTGTIDVIVGLASTPHTMTITPATPTVTAGVAQVFAVTGTNSAGASLGDISSDVTWSGLNSTDVRTGNSIVFGSAGTRTLKATIGTKSVTATVKVVAGALARLAFSKPATSAVAGEKKAFSVIGYDSKNNSLGSETSHASFTLGGAPTTSNILFTHTGSNTVAAAIGSITESTAVTVTHGATASIVLLSTVDSPVTAGTALTFTADGLDRYRNLTGVVTTKLVGKSTVSTDKFSKNTVTVTKAGIHTVTFKDGSLSDAVAFSVVPAAAATGKYVFASTATTGYLNSPFSIQVDAADAYGNAVDPTTATFAISGSSATASVSDDDATATATMVGKRTVTATTVAGNVHLSKSVSFIKDTPTVTFPTTSIVASEPSTIDVMVGSGITHLQPTGTVSLHYGSKSIAARALAGDPAVVQFSLPALAVGKYTFYASYSGNGDYNAKTSSKLVIKVVPGPLDHLKFVKPVTTTVAGTTKSFAVDGYDVHNNLIGSETSAATFGVNAETGDETIVGSKVKLTDAGSRVVTATVGEVDASTPVAVTHGAIAHITPTLSLTTPVAGDTVTISASGYDQWFNPIGDVSSQLTGKSTVASDKFVKNKVTVTKSGTRTFTVKDGAASQTLDTTVVHAALVDGKYVFTATATTVYTNSPLSLEVETADRYGNPIDDADATYTVTGSGYTIADDHSTVTFTTLGKRTITATVDGFKVSKSVTVVKDTSAGVTFTTTAIPHDVTGWTIDANVLAGPSGQLPTGTVTLHYGTSTNTQTLKQGDANTAQAVFSVKALKASSYVFYVTYSGDGNYNSKTTKKYTIKTNGVMPPP